VAAVELGSLKCIRAGIAGTVVDASAPLLALYIRERDASGMSSGQSRKVAAVG